MTDRIREILVDHYEKYLNFPGGPDVNLRLLMLCEDTITGIAIENGFDPLGDDTPPRGLISSHQEMT